MSESLYTMTMSPPVGIPGHSVGQPSALRPGDSSGPRGSDTLDVAPDSLVSTQGSLVESANDIYTSPSMICGLSTPPPSGRQSTGSVGYMDYNGRSSTQRE